MSIFLAFKNPFKGTASAIGLALGLTGSAFGLAQAPGGGQISPETANRGLIPFVIETSTGVFDLWTVTNPGGTPTLELSDFSFQELHLNGYARKDRLRINMPRTIEVDDDTNAAFLPDHILLPYEGALYHIIRNGNSEILLLQPGTSPRILISLPTQGGFSSLEDSAGVSIHGTYMLIATTYDAGGDAYVLDISGNMGPILLTGSKPPLDIETNSLRISDSGAWFQEEDILYLATNPLWQATPLHVGLLPNEELLSESVLSANGDHLVVLAEGSNGMSRILLTTIDGSTQVVTPTPGDYYPPNLDEPLGPSLAVDPEGKLVAYCQGGATEEVYLQPIGGQVIHLSSLPHFEDSLDNLGVLGFGTGGLLERPGIDNIGVLSFIGGSNMISGLTGDELMGAADMYSAQLDADSTLLVTNITRTSGQLTPPFNPPGNLVVAEATLDPLGQRMLLVGETPDDDYDLAIFFLDGGVSGPEPNLQILLSDLEEEPRFYPATTRLVVVVPPDSDTGSPTPSSLHLLQRKSPGLQVFTELASFANGEEISRVHVNKRYGGFVSTNSLGFERLHGISLRNRTTTLLTPGNWTVHFAATLRVVHNRIFCGIGPVGLPFEFMSIGPAGTSRALSLPTGLGFPLPH
ncbi:MAG TPA: hypothetical protein EYQ25_04080 [Planctomycetes bacterium]|nr:hypothetical protein [Planctomycetota bacterium]HIL37502.1 hypothetical protein [Planctomycetota bacterium]